MNNGKKVELIIKGSQGYSQDDMSDYELFVMGTLRKVKDRWIICYENENNGSTQIVVFNTKTVVIKSDGDVDYYLRLSEGKNTKATFKSQGLFSYMSIHTNKIECEMDKEKKKIELCYDLEVDIETVVKNKLVISVGLLNN